MKKLLSLLLILCIATPLEVVAACKQPVTLLEETTPAPCRGFLFSPDKAKEVTNLSEQLEFANETIKMREHQVELLKKDVADVESIIDKERKKSDLWKVTAEDTTMKLIHVNDNQGKRDGLVFAGGFLAAMLAVWAAGQLR